MACRDAASDAAATSPISNDLDPTRRHDRNKIVADLVRNRLIEDSLVPIGVEIQFEALEFHTGLTGLEPNRHRSEIGVAGLGAHRCELLIDVLNEEGCFRGRWEDFKKRCIWHEMNGTDVAPPPGSGSASVPGSARQQSRKSNDPHTMAACASF